MAIEGKHLKFDPNTEAFQMRAQLKKMENCRKQWFERWSWLLEESQEALDKANAIRREAAANLPQVAVKAEDTKSLKPVPITSTGVIGWLASRPDCQLEIYSSWMYKPPIRLPDTWDHPDYMGKQ
ncbi:uncharacterized protein LOC113498240 [Trichoplusia ni]|uniref:Uncharacterized protein LOC113498240 n=1 Tax=Trichoplusia ni TaxID=7111 RepID=A0A7E5W0N6_TRINI|nr:uncharacterized protein LOC113498240 [Trichoplusia ni]XP_026734092.1 uncharacterized protein LOC113498240 [Trichoplusia ni]XP_026734172.1 uncharacterized protein LOC113498240 [Trichoplusia ni]XP_026734217.1 uncharacterized protein LOC113498240 [Trichoplusia ni]